MTAPLPPDRPASPELARRSEGEARASSGGGGGGGGGGRAPTRRGRQWGVAELVDVGVAQVALCAAQLRVWTRAKGRLLTVAPAPAEAAIALGPAESAALVKAAQAVDRAARRGLFRPSCLVRALATRRVLGWRGLGDRAALRIGVRMRDGRLEAHAWVECGGVVLDETPRQWLEFESLADTDPAR